MLYVLTDPNNKFEELYTRRVGQAELHRFTVNDEWKRVEIIFNDAKVRYVNCFTELDLRDYDLNKFGKRDDKQLKKKWTNLRGELDDVIDNRNRSGNGAAPYDPYCLDTNKRMRWYLLFALKTRETELLSVSRVLEGAVIDEGLKRVPLISNNRATESTLLHNQQNMDSNIHFAVASSSFEAEQSYNMASSLSSLHACVVKTEPALSLCTDTHKSKKPRIKDAAQERHEQMMGRFDNMLSQNLAINDQYLSHERRMIEMYERRTRVLEEKLKQKTNEDLH